VIRNGIRDRAIGALAGLALGDVLGMPTRSMSRSRIAGRYGPITGLPDAAPDQPIAPGLPPDGHRTPNRPCCSPTCSSTARARSTRSRSPAHSAGGRPTWCGLAPPICSARRRRAIRRLHDGESPDETGREGTTNHARLDSRAGHRLGCPGGRGGDGRQPPGSRSTRGRRPGRRRAGRRRGHGAGRFGDMGHTEHVPGLPVAAIDTTGAGDALRGVRR
jgi:hypothetical protein